VTAVYLKERRIKNAIIGRQTTGDKTMPRKLTTTILAALAAIAAAGFAAKAEAKESFDLTKLPLTGSSFPGVLGDDGQLMEIVFLTMKRTGGNEFEVTGKSKFKTNICDFKGTMRVLKEEKIDEIDEIDVAGVFNGRITGTYFFNEDKSQKGTGTFKGEFEIYWANWENGIDFANFERGDGVSFIGDWTSHATKKSKKANWCDYGWCGPVTFNDGQECLIDEKYRSKGWEKYMGEYLGERYDGGTYYFCERNKEIWWKQK
jgi:hypothetical protein